MPEIFSNELICNQECKNTIFYRALAMYKSVLNELKDIENNGCAFRLGKMIKGNELKKIIHDLNVQKKVFEEIFEPANKYKIT